MTSPNAVARPSDKARAALLGWKPTSAAMARIRSRVAAETPGWSLRANETAALVTPARLATSTMVGRFTGRSSAGGRGRGLGGGQPGQGPVAAEQFQGFGQR